jgi:hypothetical protein
VSSSAFSVFQDPSLDGELTAAENMELHGVLYRVPRAERRARVEALLRFDATYPDARILNVTTPPAQPRHGDRDAVCRKLNALGTEIVYDSGDYPRLLDKALAKIGWDSLQADLQRRRAADELVGSGIAIFVEKGGLGPLDGTRVTVDGTGAVELVTGGSAVGQGFATAMAQICAKTRSPGRMPRPARCAASRFAPVTSSA